MDEATKQQLLERFAAYLESLSGEEYDSAAESEAEVPDLYTLFTELAGLRNEIKLESRQVKQALEHSRELLNTLQEGNQRLSKEVSEQRQANKAVREEAERALLLELLELRDRLAITHHSVTGFRPANLLERPRGRLRQLVDGMGEGLEITLRRIDGLLQRHALQPIESVGMRLDPWTMQAISTAHQPDQEEGVVLQEIRKGYRRGEQVLRLAEVVVNKRTETT